MQIESVKFILFVNDMSRALGFWRDVIGLREGFVSEHWTELKFGDAVIALHAGGSGEFSSTGLSLEVADLGRACAEIARGGGAVRRPPEDRPGEPILLAEVTDTERNGFSLSQMKRAG
jgi:predicted enzyme related to lactoylglutathione lyase